jgi:hypothetical protein
LADVAPGRLVTNVEDRKALDQHWRPVLTDGEYVVHIVETAGTRTRTCA